MKLIGILVFLNLVQTGSSQSSNGEVASQTLLGVTDFSSNVGTPALSSRNVGTQGKNQKRNLRFKHMIAADDDDLNDDATDDESTDNDGPVLDLGDLNPRRILKDDLPRMLQGGGIEYDDDVFDDDVPSTTTDKPIRIPPVLKPDHNRNLQDSGNEGGPVLDLDYLNPKRSARMLQGGEVVYGDNDLENDTFTAETDKPIKLPPLLLPGGKNGHNRNLMDSDKDATSRMVTGQRDDHTDDATVTLPFTSLNGGKKDKIQYRNLHIEYVLKTEVDDDDYADDASFDDDYDNGFA
jgi:hypothetical protein